MTKDLKSPIILINNVRSGTTLIQNLMALNPELVKWYEPRTLWMYADPGRRHDEFDENDATEKVVRYIRQRFLSFQRKHEDRRIVEKTPHNVFKVSYINEIFPEATFIYVIRNPLSYISSCELKWQRAVSSKGIIRRLKVTPITQLPYYANRFVRDYFDKYVLMKKYLSLWGPCYEGIEDDLRELDLLTVIARQWAIGSRKAEADLAKLQKDRVLTLRYEDFVAEPVTHLERICKHIGLEMVDEMARGAREIVDPKRQEKWRRLAPDTLMKVLPEISSQMGRHDYVVPADWSSFN